MLKLLVIRGGSLLALVFIFILFFLNGIDPDGRYQGSHQSTSSGTVTYILLDGLSQEIFERERMKGNLPHLQALIERSTYVRNGIGSFPSMTGYAFYPFITGRDAVESGILGLRWFDRDRAKGNFRNYVGRTNVEMNNDLSTEINTVFETYSDYYTASINTFLNRGVHHNLITGWAHTTSKYAETSLFSALRKVPFYGKNISKNHFEHETLVTELALAQLELNPKVQWVTYPSLDATAHIHGVDSAYHKLLFHLDQQVGTIVERIQKLNQIDRMIAVITDHGVSTVHTNIHVIDRIEKDLGLQLTRGKSVNLKSNRLEKSMQEYGDKDGFFVINGNQAAFLYLNRGKIDQTHPWRKALAPDGITKFMGHNIAEYFTLMSGVDLVAYLSGENTITILKGADRATIKYLPEQGYTYQFAEADPLYEEGLFSSGATFTPAEMLDKTIETNYPYAIPRLHKLLTLPNRPDLLITTLPGFDLAADYELFVGNYKGGHGGIRGEILRVPYILYLPGQESKEVNMMLSEDFGKMIIEHLKIASNNPLVN